MTLDELQNIMLTELNKAHPRSASLFKITEDILKYNTGSIPDGPPMKRLLDEGLITSSPDGIGFYKITSRGKKFIETGGYNLNYVVDNKKNFWQRIFSKG
jgi:hypothetical protein